MGGISANAGTQLSATKMIMLNMANFFIFCSLTTFLWIMIIKYGENLKGGTVIATQQSRWIAALQ